MVRNDNLTLVLAGYKNEILQTSAGSGTYRPARLSLLTKTIKSAVINNTPNPSLELKRELKNSIEYAFSFSSKIMLNTVMRSGVKYDKNIKNELQFLEQSIHKDLFIGVLLNNPTHVDTVMEVLESGFRLGSKTVLKKPQKIIVHDGINLTKIKNDSMDIMRITPVPERLFNYDVFINKFIDTNFYFHSYASFDIVGEELVINHYIEPYTKRGSAWELEPFTNDLIKGSGYQLPQEIINELPKALKHKIGPTIVIV